ncbi:hypothetical protein ACJIZ3_023257 [Penstemon smallii]|uniref:K Homology domain-containing protein n=1 Tax=Penstemon smallii TaxID=265156 RepID=A0ABD3TPZ2_9LAMI
MEETPFLSHTFTNSETNQHQNHRGPDPGQVAFRLLCHVHNAGGVIGSSGSIIKNLEILTGSRIRFEEGLPNCLERVINIVGDAAVDKWISFGVEEEEMVEVSKAQEGLMRVFERVLEVEGNCGGNDDDDSNEHYSNGGFVVGCRLLAPTGRIGAVMGKGGKIVDGIRRSSGARIRVLKKEQIPACAASEEELIQIMGGVLAVKKALLAVSRRLQDRKLGEAVAGHVSSYGVSHNSHADFIPNNNPNSLSFMGNGIEHHSVGHSLSADFERTNTPREVVFRLLCSNGIAGGVIGKGANIVKSLEKETGASIKFTSPVSGSKERVAIISSWEKPDPLFSPAQIAIIRVFSRCIEVGLDQGVISSLGKRDRVIARILIQSSQVGCLMDEGGRLALDMSIAAPGVEIQILDADLPNCAGDDDNVVQIFFTRVGPIGSSPNGREADSTQLAQLTRLSYIDQQLDHLGFVQKSSVTDSPGLHWEHANRRGNVQRHVNSAQGSTTSPCKHEIKVENEVPKQIVEVIVPRKLFGSVYGENGSNLARLKEISGASIILQDPYAGESNGKVVISGTPERIQIAQSLLQAFVSF